MVRRVFAVVNGSLHPVGGVVAVEDHTAQHEHRVLREERAQSGNGGRGVADAAQSTFTPCPCSRAAG